MGSPNQTIFIITPAVILLLLSVSSSDPCETSPSELCLVQNSQLGWTLRSVRQTVSNPFYKHFFDNVECQFFLMKMYHKQLWSRGHDDKSLNIL